jgi:16S rRNA (cytosine967-C5)-methyltransferase
MIFYEAVKLRRVRYYLNPSHTNPPLNSNHPNKKNQAMTDIPRKTALLVLDTLSQKHHSHLDRIITDVVDNADLHLSGRDRNFINILIFGVLRWREKIDWIIARHSNTPLKKINPGVLNILRLGLYQIFFLDRVPDSAAVNTSVELAKQSAPQWVVKYVNAVLRNAVRSQNTLAFPSMGDDPARSISVNQSFPLWLTRRWIKRFGIKDCQALCDAFNAIPPITVRCNTLKLLREKLQDALLQDAQEICVTLYSPAGLSFEQPQKPISEFSAFQNGLFQVQDEAAQLIACLLAPQPHEIILDACAGVGGKTGHIAQLMENKGRIIAADRDRKKLSQLENTMQQLGVGNVTITEYDFNQPVQNFKYSEFDRILVDAPCSGTGVIRRNPDTKWNVSESLFTQSGKNQLHLLRNISSLLKIGGTLIYAVCSFEPEENESVINRFLQTHKNFVVCRTYSNLPFDIRSFSDSNGFFRTFPHIHDMDGFFAVCLKRIA